MGGGGDDDMGDEFGGGDGPAEGGGTMAEARIVGEVGLRGWVVLLVMSASG